MRANCNQHIQLTAGGTGISAVPQQIEGRNLSAVGRLTAGIAGRCANFCQPLRAQRCEGNIEALGCRSVLRAGGDTRSVTASVSLADWRRAGAAARFAGTRAIVAIVFRGGD